MDHNLTEAVNYLVTSNIGSAGLGSISKVSLLCFSHFTYFFFSYSSTVLIQVLRVYTFLSPCFKLMFYIFPHWSECVFNDL